MSMFVISLFVVSSLLISPAAKTQSLAGYVFSTTDKTTPFTLKLNPFTTDGCSKYSDGTKENPTLWRDCCIAHDAKYWLGGTSLDRKNADVGLYQCVKDKGEPTHARIMYLGTRAGGGPLNHTTYRWGYGWNRVRDYKTLTADEKKMAYDMYGQDLVKLKESIQENNYVLQVPDSYEFVSPFPYSYCEEEIINYLSPKISRNATVTEAHDFEANSLYTISINLDICSDPIEFEFDRNTNASSCKKDFAYAKVLNKISNVRISSDCAKKL